MGKETPLGRVVATKAAAEKSKAEREAEWSSKLRELGHGRRGEVVDVPGLGPIRIEMVGTRVAQEIERDIWKVMLDRSMPLSIHTSDRWEIERALQTIARSTFDPSDTSKPFGTLEEWGEIDQDLLMSAWVAYGDVAARLNPLREELDDTDRAEIEIAVKKKASQLLRSFGLWKLSVWLSTTESPPLTSPKPTLESGESSSEP